MKDCFKLAQQFVHRNARAIDLVIWQYLFEDGDRDAVLKELAFFQNEDGGFGHALETDFWNPASSPMQTWYAAQILRTINFTDKNHDVVTRMKHYLSHCPYFNGKRYCRVTPPNNDYPHAPWWHCSDDYLSEESYNPTAALAGFYLAFGDENDPFLEVAEQVVRQAVGVYMGTDIVEPHELSCFVQLYEYCKSMRSDLVLNMLPKLKEDIRIAIDHPPEKWATEYHAMPSWYITSKNELAEGNEKMIAAECEFILSRQLPNGSWPTPWSWGAYPDECAISINRWRSVLAYSRLLFLQTFHSGR
jgi:hypothetical protein